MSAELVKGNLNQTNILTTFIKEMTGIFIPIWNGCCIEWLGGKLSIGLCHWMLLHAWPSGKLPFDCQKIAKNLTFFPKNCQKFSFFSQKLPLAIFFEKNDNFWLFFWKSESFGNFLTVKWQFSGGSVLEPP